VPRPPQIHTRLAVDWRKTTTTFYWRPRIQLLQKPAKLSYSEDCGPCGCLRKAYVLENLHRGTNQKAVTMTHTIYKLVLGSLFSWVALSFACTIWGCHDTIFLSQLTQLRLMLVCQRWMAAVRASNEFMTIRDLTEATVIL
jgi:hypothetical protein